MSGAIRSAVNALFSTAVAYLPGTLGQRLKDYADNTDPAKGAALVGYNGRALAVDKDQVMRIENIHALRDFFKALFAFHTVENTTITIASYGDSVSADVAGALHQYLLGLIGYENSTSFTSGQFAATPGGATVYTGGAAQVVTPISGGNPIYLPTGIWDNIPSGGSVTHMNGGQQYGYSKAVVYLATEPGNGTATVDLLNEALVVVSTQVINTNAALGAVKAEFTGLDTRIKYRLKVTASTAKVIDLGIAMLKPRGITNLAWQFGGTTWAYQNLSSKAIFDYINNDLGTCMFVVESKEDGEDGGMPKLATRLNALTASKLYIHTRPDSSSSYGQYAAMLTIRDSAVANGYAFVDANHMLKDYAEVVRLGWNGDGTHLDSKSAYFIASLIFQHMPIARFAKFYGTGDVFSAKVVSDEFSVRSPASSDNAYRIKFADSFSGAAPTLVKFYNVGSIQFGSGATASKFQGYDANTALLLRGDGVTPGTMRLGAVSQVDAAQTSGFAGPVQFAKQMQLAAYTVATLPNVAGYAVAFASNGRKVGEGSGAGTGVMVYQIAFGQPWRVFSTDAAVAA